MTWGRVLLGVGAACMAVLAVWLVRDPAGPFGEAAACASCDARHQRLVDLPGPAEAVSR